MYPADSVCDRSHTGRPHHPSIIPLLAREETNGNPHTAKKGISIFTTGISKSTGKLFPNMHNVGGAIPIGKAIEERSEQRAKATEEKRQRAEEITAKKTTKKKKMKLKKVMMPKEVKRTEHGRTR
ncbi:hypothetical protein BLNAU_1275 [Blattamonas nauphoetae]|uniref:Uncharacterized protein n=1 Tax=Blattamonas nauphoetae TaxID=2049346 RepID=A0ABQ9YJF0_9EUKA|nr:hypothetical protein BLNAU_1275 [Blattamonas nauphoetae]